MNIVRDRTRLGLLMAWLVVFAPRLLSLEDSRTPIPAASSTPRPLEFETREVTGADITISPDGQRLIFTILGHLFLLPLTGGDAEQLTFGPYYDSDAVFSPDGSRVAFVSDRDGSEGNIFVLELTTGAIRQITRETWAGRPVWTPDGDAIVYLSFLAPGVEHYGLSIRWRRASVRQTPVTGGEPRTLSPSARLYRSVFFLPDGRVAWTVIEPDATFRRWEAHVEALGADGKVTLLRTVPGYVERAVVSPDGGGLYCRRRPDVSDTQHQYLHFVPLAGGDGREISSVTGHWWRAPRFALAPDHQSVLLSDEGQIWRVALPGGSRETVPFRATVNMEVHDPIAPRARAVSSTDSIAIVSPVLSPDGKTIIFAAAGDLWIQDLEGGPAERLTATRGTAQAPAISPDGRNIAFVQTESGEDEIRTFDLETRQTRTVASGLTYWAGDPPSWSPDGRRLVFTRFDGETFRVTILNVSDGTSINVIEAAGEWWSLRPHFSADGKSLYLSDNRTGIGTLYHLPLDGDGQLKPITDLDRHLSDGLVSPDGKWLAFRRNMEIWVARLDKATVTEADVWRLRTDTQKAFGFTPDSSAVIYSDGSRVWRHPLLGHSLSDDVHGRNGAREEIPIRLELEPRLPPPLLLRGVRLLRFPEGFSGETSLFVEQGRIRWIGSEEGRAIPPETVVLEGEGRFVIPGLIDLHVHGDSANQAGLLAYGITTVRDTGGSLARLRALADRRRLRSDPVPRYFFSGEQFYGAQPLTSDWGMMLHDEEEARTYARRWKDSGAHFIKVHAPISWPLQRVVAEEARILGLAVVGHGFSVEEITRSVTLGYSSLVHITRFGRFYDDVFQLLAAAGTHWDPDLALYGGNDLLLREEPERLADAKLRAFVSGPDIENAANRSLRWAGGEKELRGQWQQQLAAVRAAHRRGVKLQIGTDSGGAGGSREDVFFGPALHWELEFFVEAGLPPLEVLRIATRQAAEALGVANDLGTIEPGKLADLILLDENPLEEIRNTRTIWRVLQNGRLFDPAELARIEDQR